MSNKKQSSIEWLVEQLIPNAMRMFDATTCNAIEKAKEMHKEEITDALDVGYQIANEYVKFKHIHTAEKYYNEKFGGDDE